MRVNRNNRLKTLRHNHQESSLRSTISQGFCKGRWGWNTSAAYTPLLSSTRVFHSQQRRSQAASAKSIWGVFLMPPPFSGLLALFESLASCWVCVWWCVSGLGWGTDFLFISDDTAATSTLSTPIHPLTADPRQRWAHGMENKPWGSGLDEANR